MRINRKNALDQKYLKVKKFSSFKAVYNKTQRKNKLILFQVKVLTKTLNFIVLNSYLRKLTDACSVFTV